ncbi:hypothetical protein BT63DRAFT_420704 [Microthyrium microscopicum]|uniref:Uncharacterized protein n=1 Tax=Microthyrium microscopicum TaxID=703497 RepID=A0A6A6UVS2_9PEZI|nr:hypothetical protein BT63DRAFT_420704 [Microthyrium microscopicum]
MESGLDIPKFLDKEARSGETMRKRINVQTDALVKNFQNILDDVATKSRDERTDLVSVKDRSLQTELRVQNMIRAAEGLTMTIRQMQEMWLFGKLDTVRPQEEKEELDDILELVRKLIEHGTKLADEKGASAEGFAARLKGPEY